ncbi:hypothetical protein [Aestuariimicrobium kwangyangense]|uniref:hypothetical protein n=1 Tax=Aestuariimicrobium kwangyangense TaxID=396389 RepID=UPI0003B4CF35|nr:hypothetical protein [Aestuariimicrobium kwangyangense]
MHRRQVVLGVGVAALLPGLAACGAISSAVSPVPGTPSATPTTGVTLASMGLVHGPRTITLPTGLVPVRTIDQPNVVTLILRAANSARVQTHLEQTLPVSGFTVDARSADSLVFHDATWDGAWTSSAELAGLTFRRRT